jgi:hypothetical protein
MKEMNQIEKQILAVYYAWATNQGSDTFSIELNHLFHLMGGKFPDEMKRTFISGIMSAKGKP